MIYISRTIPILNAGTLDVVKSVLSSNGLRDITRTELDAIDGRLAQLAAGPADPPSASIPSACPPKVERLQALLLSIFPGPEDSGWVELILGQGTSFSGATVCQFIREKFSQ